MKYCLIFIPTYNEINNIDNILKKIRNLYPDIDILVIDDNSSDGTVSFLKSLSDKKISHIIRKKKDGIGSAHKDGINYAYNHEYNFLITMDADGTHEPESIETFIKLMDQFDIVNTNRFIKKNSLIDWPLTRKIFTYTRYYLNKILLGVSLDSSGAFRSYNLKKIKKEHLIMASGNSYSFFWESLFILKEKQYKIFEIPINLPYRKNGSSKIKLNDIILSFILIIVFFFKRILKIYR